MPKYDYLLLTKIDTVHKLNNGAESGRPGLKHIENGPANALSCSYLIRHIWICIAGSKSILPVARRILKDKC